MSKPGNKTVATIAIIIIMMVVALAEAVVADELEKKLAEVDKLRAGMKTPFNEVEKRCKSLLAEYTKPEEQARIYYQWAHVEGQSFLQHPDKELEYVKKALSLPLEPEKRLQLYMYWGNAIEVSRRGVKGQKLKIARRESVAPYLQALADCEKYIADVSNEPLPPQGGVASSSTSPMPDNRALTARNYAVWLKKKKLERIRGFQAAFENQIAYLYSRAPLATEEIRTLAEQMVPDKATQERLMVRVRAEIEKRTEEKKKHRDAVTGPTRDEIHRRWVLGVAGTLLLVLVAIFVWRRFRRASHLR